MEIERKWLVPEPPDDLLERPGDRIEQGYLAIGAGGSEVRLRRRADQLTLTAKTGRGLSRGEHEVELTPEQFESLWPGTEGRRLVKTRRTLAAGGSGELVIELDVYAAGLTGLVVAEVEFEDEAAAGDFVAPGWFGHEVTEDDAYKNQRLAVDGLPGSR
jgi:adenylate cyclase